MHMLSLFVVIAGGAAVVVVGCYYYCCCHCRHCLFGVFVVVFDFIVVVAAAV